VTPFTPVEAAAEEAAKMMAANAHRGDSEEGMADNTDNDYDLEQDGRSRRGRATAHGKRPPLPTRCCRTPAGTIAPESHATDAEEEMYGRPSLSRPRTMSMPEKPVPLLFAFLLYVFVHMFFCISSLAK